MKKYLYILKSELMSNLQYIFDIIVGFSGYFLMIFIFINLWQYMYSDPNELINGFSMNQMIWYVMVTEIIWMSLGGRKLCRRISTDVKGGNIAYNINKPYSYIGYIVSNHLGDVLLKLFLYTIFGIIMGLIFLKTMPNINLLNFIIVFITIILSIIVSIFIITSLGLLAFFIEDSGPFYWIYSKIILVVGTLFPIEFFPKFLRPLLTYSPIFAISYGPAKLFVDFSYSMCSKVILSQLVYLLLSYLLCSFIYKKGVKKLNVNGG